MGKTNKNFKYISYGLNGSRKNIGVNYWRFFFNGQDTISGLQQMFFIELRLINPWTSPNEIVLGYTPRVKISEEALQYALAGTLAAKELKTEALIEPSYVCITIGKTGKDAKQLSKYIPLKDITFSSKELQIRSEYFLFSESSLMGEVQLTEQEVKAHPEFFSNAGRVTWNLNYEFTKFQEKGFSGNSINWIPCGLVCNLSGRLIFNGIEYIIDPKKAYAYSERYWAKSYLENWFHISSANLTSRITGKPLYDTCFTVHGGFNNRVSFLCHFPDSEVEFFADDSNRSYTCIFDCVQAPESDNSSENLLHWTVSLTSKVWIVDIDIYCKINELSNRTLELPEGKRQILNMLQGGTGTGEIKIYRKNKNIIEQIEDAKIESAVCEFGQIEKNDKTEV